MTAPFGATWGTLIERCEELFEDATLITPLSNKQFRVTDVQQQRVVIEDTDTDDSPRLQHDSSKRRRAHSGFHLLRIRD